MSAAFQPPSSLPPPLPGSAPAAAAPMAHAPLSGAPPLNRPDAPITGPIAGRAPPRSRSMGAVIWGLLALVAVGYLALVLVRPDLVASHFPNAPQPGQAEPNGTRADVASATEVQELKGVVDGLRKDLDAVKSQNRELSERLASLSGTSTVGDLSAVKPAAAPASDLPPPQLRLDSAPVNGPLNPRSSADAGKAAAPATPTAVPAAKLADAKILNPAANAVTTTAAKPIETGSVKPPTAAAQALTATSPAVPPAEVPAFSAPVVKAAPKSVGLQIATGSSLDSLRLSWNLLSETHADNLKNLEPRYSTSVDGSGLVYNLTAGPVKSEADAKKMCKDLAAKAIPCKVIGNFDGAPL